MYRALEDGPQSSRPALWREIRDQDLQAWSLHALEALLADLLERAVAGATAHDPTRVPALRRQPALAVSWSWREVTRVARGEAVRYRVQLPDGVLSVPVVYNVAVWPTRVWQAGLDYFEVAGGLEFVDDPRQDPQVAASVVPGSPADVVTVIDGAILAGVADEDLPDPATAPVDFLAGWQARELQRRTLVTEGLCSYATLTRTTGGVLVVRDDAVPVALGDSVTYPVGDATVSAQVLAVSPDGRVTLVPAPPASAMGTRVAVRRLDVLHAVQVGDTVVVAQDERGLRLETTVRAVRAQDGEIELADAWPFGRGDSDAVRLSCLVRSGVVEQRLTLYGVNVTHDTRHLGRVWGVLSDHREPSSEAYRAVLLSALSLWWSGPSDAALLRLLLAPLGLGPLEQDQVLQGAQDAGVVTHLQTSVGNYTVPSSMVDPVLLEPANWGHLVLVRGQSLLHTSRVYGRSVETFLGHRLPAGVLGPQPGPVVDASLVPSRLGPDARLPERFGFDFDGGDAAVLQHARADALYAPDGVRGHLYFADGDLAARFAGCRAELEGHTVVLGEVLLDQDTVVLGSDPSRALGDFYFPDAQGIADTLTCASARFTQHRALGRHVRVVIQAGVTLTHVFRVYEVVDSRTLRVRTLSGAVPNLTAWRGSVSVALSCVILEREPLAAQAGFDAARICAPNVLGLEQRVVPGTPPGIYTSARYAQHARRGKPAWAFLDVNAFQGLAAWTGTWDAVTTAQAAQPQRIAVSVDTWRIGDLPVGLVHVSHDGVAYSSEARLPSAALAGLVTPQDLLAPYSHGAWVDARTATAVRALVRGSGVDVDVDLHVWDGVQWTYADTYTLDADGTPTVLTLGAGEVFGLRYAVAPGGDYVVQVDLTRDALARDVVWDSGPRGTATVVQDDAEANLGVGLAECDVGLLLEMVFPPSGGLRQVVQTLIVAGVDGTSASFVDLGTGQAWTAPRDATATWYALGHMGWGHTPWRVGDSAPLWAYDLGVGRPSQALASECVSCKVD